MRERAQLVEACGFRAAYELVHDPAPHAAASGFAAHDHRPDFRDGPAQRRQLGARQYLAVLHGNDEAVRVDENLAKLAGQQVAFRQVLVDQFVDRVDLVGRSRTNGDCLRIRDQDVRCSRSPDPESF